ncbi:MAG: hypothetical protein LBQ82_09490, partial [Treponema sp.]|nr:hypothetical protein [Treponema sp.]
LSEWCEAYVHIDGKVFTQRYKIGIPEGAAKEIAATALPYNSAPDRRGTVIRWKADNLIFETTTHNFFNNKEKNKKGGSLPPRAHFVAPHPPQRGLTPP